MYYINKIKMIKNIFFGFIVVISNFSNIFAWNNWPKINCEWLPGCDSDDLKVIEKVSSNIIAEMIKYVAVLAVIALMISWVMYMFSDWEEEKTKKAKSWILWSLTAVILSISSYYIVTTIAWIEINV